MICPKCRFDNTSDSKFCKECGTQLLQTQDLLAQTRTLEIPRDDLTTGSLFAGRYQIIEELGKGGMGKIFKALDRKVNEEVAIKLIRPEIAMDRRTLDRFSAEMKLARKIVHKNVGRVYELMEDRGIHFITMEYVEGQDLRDLIRQTGRLTTAKAIAIARQVCEGLVEAHRLGVVHRDLKPGNIMIDKNGDARIMDFGIARSLGAKSATAAGVIIGTPDYMSPEQVDGKDVDQRSDIYSLGVILYEMVTGRVPFEGDTPLSVAVKHKTEAPQDPSLFNPLVPENLSQVILKCLEKSREDRYQSAEELISALSGIEEEIPTTERALAKLRQTRSRQIARGVSKSKGKKIALYAGAIVLLALIIFAGLHLFTGRKKASIDSIAVLPFENVNKDPVVENLCGEIPDAIRAGLSGLPNFKNISRNSVKAYKGQDVSPKRIGQELNVEAILTGTVTRLGDRLVARTELVRTSDGSMIREWKFDGNPNGKPEDVFALIEEKEMGASILQELGRTLSVEDKKQVSKKLIKNSAAYEYFLRAMQEIDILNKESIDRALVYLQRALEISGADALIYSGMGWAYFAYSDFVLDRTDIYYTKGEECFKKAFDLDPDLPQAHAYYGWFCSQNQGDQRAAVRHFKKALAANPEEPMALEGLAVTYIEYLGKISAASPLAEMIKKIDPLNWTNSWIPGGQQFFMGRYDLALEPWRYELKLYPNDPAFIFWLSQALFYAKKLEEAFSFIDQNAKVNPNTHFSKMGLMLRYAFQKNKEKAFQEMSSDFQKTAKRDGDSSRVLAVIMALLGEKTQALDWLENSINHGFINYPFLEKDPFFENIRGEERFKKLLERAKYEFEHFDE